VQNPIVVGETCLVKRIISVKHGIVEVDHNGTSRVVASGKFKGSIEEGDRVLLDSSYSIVLINHRKPAPRFTFTETTNVTWDDIGGLAEAKQSMIEAIEFPIIHAEQYGFYGKKPIKGAMLYGPPGCGKTMLAKATATSLSKLHKGASAKTGFIYVKGPEILDKFVGVAEANVRGLFQQARKHKQEHGYPALIFIDEADAILGIRGSGISSDIERTVVPMFLAEMDGLDDSGAIVLLSTNRPDTLDPAIVRDGRIDRKIKVTRPDAESVVDVFKLHLRGVPFHNGYSTEDVAVAGRNALFAEEKKLFEIHVVNGHERVLPLKLGHICNGAMVAGIVDQATSIALHRDIKKGGKPGGVTLQDMAQAVDRVYEQNLDIDHKDAIAEMVQDFRDDVRRVTKVCRQGNTAQGVRQ
jgi:proteasome-associated ATPase